ASCKRAIASSLVSVFVTLDNFYSLLKGLQREEAHLKRVMVTTRITKMNSRSHRWGRRGGWLKGIAYPKAKTNYPVRFLAEWRTEYPLRLAPLSPPVWQCRESNALQSCRSGSAALPQRNANLHLRRFP